MRPPHSDERRRRTDTAGRALARYLPAGWRVVTKHQDEGTKRNTWHPLCIPASKRLTPSEPTAHMGRSEPFAPAPPPIQFSKTPAKWIACLSAFGGEDWRRGEDASERSIRKAAGTTVPRRGRGFRQQAKTRDVAGTKSNRTTPVQSHHARGAREVSIHSGNRFERSLECTP